MKPVVLLSVIALSASPAFAKAFKGPLNLKKGEQITMVGNSGDVLNCQGKDYRTYKGQHFNIVVVENVECVDGSIPKKIYIDGILAGSCSEKLIFNKMNWSASFLDFKLLDELSDEEVVKLSETSIGQCSYNSHDKALRLTYYAQPVAQDMVKEAFASYLSDNAVALNKKATDTAVIAKSIREAMNDGLCGHFEPSEKELKESKKLLARFDIGMDLLIKKGASVDDLLDLRYPAKKLKERFKLSAQDFKKAGYSAYELVPTLFSVKELAASGYSTKDLVSELNVEVLKPYYSLKEMREAGLSTARVKQAGYTAKEAKESGYDLKALQNNYWGDDLKAAFHISEFKANGYSVQNLKSMGYKAAEIKEQGFSFKEMSEHYWGEDLKKLYTIKDLKDNGYAVQNLKSMGYKAAEIKDQGFTFSQMSEHFWGEDLKKLYTIQDFRANGYTVQNLKNMGYKADEIKAQGYSFQQMSENYWGQDLKNLYSINEFKANGYNAQNLKSMGFTNDEIKAAGFSDEEVQYLN